MSHETLGHKVFETVTCVLVFVLLLVFGGFFFVKVKLLGVLII